MKSFIPFVLISVGLFVLQNTYDGGSQKQPKYFTFDIEDIENENLRQQKVEKMKNFKERQREKLNKKTFKERRRENLTKQNIQKKIKQLQNRLKEN